MVSVTITMTAMVMMMMMMMMVIRGYDDGDDVNDDIYDGKGTGRYSKW